MMKVFRNGGSAPTIVLCHDEEPLLLWSSSVFTDALPSRMRVPPRAVCPLSDRRRLLAYCPLRLRCSAAHSYPRSAIATSYAPLEIAWLGYRSATLQACVLAALFGTARHNAAYLATPTPSRSNRSRVASETWARTALHFRSRPCCISVPQNGHRWSAHALSDRSAVVPLVIAQKERRAP
ncbi:hypothetical protein BV20DRAFT_16272 [Pilatotrama ljubarskyi]|nr:hypothetical protein BV20DRAFT_16272 [Pilatotrama ljubarskyi]